MKKLRATVRKNGKRGNWIVDYDDPLTNKRKRPSFKTKKEADRERNRLVIEVSQGKIPSDKLFLGNLMVIHLKKCPRTKVMSSNRVRFSSFYEYFKHFHLSDIGKRELQNWFDGVLDEGLSEKTCNRLKAQFSHFFNWCVEEGYLLRNPLRLLKFSENGPQKRLHPVLSKKEVKDILDKAREFENGVLYNFLYVISHTGARRGAILNLEWKNIDFNLGTIIFIKTKNGESRIIRMDENLQKLLSKMKQERVSDDLFVGERGNKLSEHTLRGYLLRFKANHYFEKNWTLPSFRHSFAYAFKRAGGNIYELQALLGHKTGKLTTDLYGKISAEDVETICPYDF